ncbi:MAG: DUF4258 domain-containing protein [Armatimonadota bacterium]
MHRVVITNHARFELHRRGIPEEDVREVALAPEQVVFSSKRREVRQSRVHGPVTGRTMLLRVVVEKREGTLVVVTAYKTSKMDKYWVPEAEA